MSVSATHARSATTRAARIAAGVEKAKLERLNAALAAHNSFEAIAEEWYARNQREGLAPITLRKIRWLIDIARLDQFVNLGPADAGKSYGTSSANRERLSDAIASSLSRHVETMLPALAENRRGRDIGRNV